MKYYEIGLLINKIITDRIIVQDQIRTPMTTNSNSSQRPNKSIIQNLKNSKLFEPSKYKKQV